MHCFMRALLIWLLCLLAVLFHELGHALGYRISGGSAGWRVIAGSGPRILGTSKATFRLIPAGGYFVPGEEPKTNRGKIAMLAGGPFISLLLAILFGIVRLCVPALIQPESSLHEILFQVSGFLLMFNVFQFLFTAIPMRYRVVCRGFESDGLQIVRILKQRGNKQKKQP